MLQIILQIFYNYIVLKIDDIVNDMEDSSISLVDLIANYKKNKLKYFNMIEVALYFIFGLFSVACLPAILSSIISVIKRGNLKKYI